MRITLTALMLVLLAGCSMLSAERSQLPNGVTLLETKHFECTDRVVFEGDIDVDKGESTVIKLDDSDDIGVACLGRPHGKDEFDCPPGSDYIRVIREKDRSRFTVECFG